jgi:hypothetical protein
MKDTLVNYSYAIRECVKLFGGNHEYIISHINALWVLDARLSGCPSFFRIAFFQGQNEAEDGKKEMEQLRAAYLSSISEALDSSETAIYATTFNGERRPIPDSWLPACCLGRSI